MAEIATQQPDDGGSLLRRWGLAISLAAIWQVLCSAVAPHLPLWPLPAYAVAFASVSLGALAAAAWAPGAGRIQLAVVPALAALGVVYTLGLGGRWPAVLVTLGLLTTGTLVGAAVGHRIEHPGHLLFVVPISAAADVLSVHHPEGVSAAIIADDRALSVLALSFPMLGTPAVEPLLGVGDVVFLALYFGVARSHRLPLVRTFAALGLALLCTAAVVVLTAQPIPALPLLGVAMLVAHPEARRPRAQDRLAGMVGLGLAAAAVAWLLVFRP